MIFSLKFNGLFSLKLLGLLRLRGNDNVLFWSPISSYNLLLDRKKKNSKLFFGDWSSIELFSEPYISGMV